MANVWSDAVSAGLAYGWGFIHDAASVLGLVLILALVAVVIGRLR